MDSRSCVVVFTKPAVPGRVKTRLFGALTPAEAAALHAAFLTDLLDELQRAPVAVRIAWALEGPERVPLEMAKGFRQEGGDLGERLANGLGRVAGGFERIGAVGSDHPDLTAGHVTEAFAALDDADVAIVPADDGGYALIAVRAAALHARLFEEVPWSTGEVLSVTRERIAELGLRAKILPVVPDVDTPADLAALGGRIAAEAVRCPATRRLLARWGGRPAEVKA